MQIWLLHIGEQLPVDGRMRPFRYGYLARVFEEAGHEVLRWAPTFCHVTKTHRFTADCRVQISDKYAIQFVHSQGYRRNAGLERLRTYRVLGRRFRQLAAREPPPDLIIAAIPSLEWAQGAVEYGRTRGIPVVVDVRDLWPDVFLNALPRSARSASRFLLAPYYRAARTACRQATLLTAVSQSYLDWALRLAGRKQSHGDRVVPLGFEPERVPTKNLQGNVEKLRALGIDPARPICLFAGLFERSYELETVVDAARRLKMAGRDDVQFVLCGDGSKGPAIKRRAEGLRNVHLLGWVDAAMLHAAASISSIGLCTYARDALQSLPNKPFEYMAGRLAIVSSLQGELARLVERHQCGVTYQAGSAESLADCLGHLLGNPQRLDAMRSNGYRAWARNYRSHEIYARFVTHLATSSKPFARAA